MCVHVPVPKGTPACMVSVVDEYGPGGALWSAPTGGPTAINVPAAMSRTENAVTARVRMAGSSLGVLTLSQDSLQPRSRDLFASRAERDRAKEAAEARRPPPSRFLVGYARERRRLRSAAAAGRAATRTSSPAPAFPAWIVAVASAGGGAPIGFGAAL